MENNALIYNNQPAKYHQPSSGNNVTRVSMDDTKVWMWVNKMRDKRFETTTNNQRTTKPFCRTCWSTHPSPSQRLSTRGTTHAPIRPEKNYRSTTLGCSF